MAWKGVDTMWILPSALNVKVKKFNQAQVNGGSNYLLPSEHTAKGTGLE